jgi:hypothetical protein
VLASAVRALAAGPRDLAVAQVELREERAAPRRAGSRRAPFTVGALLCRDRACASCSVGPAQEAVLEQGRDRLGIGPGRRTSRRLAREAPGSRSALA